MAKNFAASTSLCGFENEFQWHMVLKNKEKTRKGRVFFFVNKKEAKKTFGVLGHWRFKHRGARRVEFSGSSWAQKELLILTWASRHRRLDSHLAGQNQGSHCPAAGQHKIIAPATGRVRHTVNLGDEARTTFRTILLNSGAMLA